MTTRYELIVFDWDGTLMDSAALIAASIQNACRDLDLPIPNDERARYIIGLGLHQSMQYLLPDLPESEYPKLGERYRHHFLARDQESVLFDGVPEMLELLGERGHRLAVATGKSRVGLDRALDQTGIGAHFRATRCADESQAKPHPAMLFDLMNTLAVAPEKTLMIGDTSHDLQMAANAGVASLAVAYGAHGRDELAKFAPRARVDSIAELEQWLTSNG
jgi:phosphoglycolate phosphatase